MRKRRRKKLHLQEFQELGFEVSFSFSGDPESFDDFLDEFLAEAIEANGLVCGGGGKPADLRFFVSLDGRGKLTDAHREKVRKWLAEREDVNGLEAGALVDAWYGELADGDKESVSASSGRRINDEG